MSSLESSSVPILRAYRYRCPSQIPILCRTKYSPSTGVYPRIASCAEPNTSQVQVSIQELPSVPSLRAYRYGCPSQIPILCRTKYLTGTGVYPRIASCAEPKPPQVQGSIRKIPPVPNFHPQHPKRRAEVLSYQRIRYMPIFPASSPSLLPCRYQIPPPPRRPVPNSSISCSASTIHFPIT